MAGRAESSHLDLQVGGRESDTLRMSLASLLKPLRLTPVAHLLQQGHIFHPFSHSAINWGQSFKIYESMGVILTPS